jgi:hypothetical protein
MLLVSRHVNDERRINEINELADQLLQAVAVFGQSGSRIGNGKDDRR